ncbi:urea transporter [Antrihabitans cavernicola]|uniref:urea transporter n=1 Tax=Antrihabitans cavernicola TaxID=2495913 RepID=UPI001F196522|nr:urea transporter [Spelaeibacter cavernicola]
MASAAVAGVLGTWNIPTLTIPFCLIASVMTISAPNFQHIWNGRAAETGLGQPVLGRTDLVWSDIWRAFFASFAQIFLAPQWYVGAIFLLGILVASRRAALVASIGSIVGIAIAWTLGSPAQDIRAGLLGYNAVLVTLALDGVFVMATGWGLAFAIIGAGASTAVSGALAETFAPIGGHTLTWPYCLTTLTFLLAVPSLPRLHRSD